MNFTITIQDGNGRMQFQIQSGTVSIQPSASTDKLKVQCLVRPDDWLELRSNVVAQSGADLTFATIIESDPVRDPNHWLKKTDAQMPRVPDSQAVRSRRHRVRRNGASKRKP